MAAGGLFICGTERHESRRIDNQLRGRAGRQGDPGESRFFLSAEDDLVRLFAGDRIYRILDKLGGIDEEGNEEPIEAGMLSKQIEKAQKKVEEQNFLQRKSVLEYDDVMNEQRRVIYAYRNEVLEGKSIGEEARQEVANVLERTIEQYTPGDIMEDWDMDGLYMALGQFFPRDLDNEALNPDTADRESLIDGVIEFARALRRARSGARRGADGCAGAVSAAGDHRRTLARASVRHGLPARGHPPARVRPDRPAGGIQERSVRAVRRPDEQRLGGLHAHGVQRPGERRRPERQRQGAGSSPGPAPFAASGSATRAGRVSYSGGRSAAGAGAIAAAAASAGVRPQRRPGGSARMPKTEEPEPELATVVEQRVIDDEHQVGRNDPCWCGSGKKFKKCHGA